MALQAIMAVIGLAVAELCNGAHQANARYSVLVALTCWRVAVPWITVTLVSQTAQIGSTAKSWCGR
jgi:hypothetical protein